MRNNDFHQTQPGQVEKTSVLGNWANFEVDRTKIEMYMPIQIISHQKPSLGATYFGRVSCPDPPKSRYIGPFEIIGI